MGTKRFRTRTTIEPKNNGSLPGVFEIAIDAGYGGVKVISNNWNICFPAFAKRAEDGKIEFVGDAPESAILYKDLSSGELWIVGEFAQNMASAKDTTDSESSLFSRDRYTNPLFMVSVRVGLGLAVRKNEFNGYTGQSVYIQTGLPEKYMNDADDLRDALSGTHEFALKVGNNDWEEFSLNIDPKNVDIIPQPKGSLFSVCMDRKGQFVRDAQKYLRSSVLVFDSGFGTLDLFPIISGVVKGGETYPDLGMRRIMQETVNLIKEKYNVVTSVPAMQKNLETGLVRYGKGFESKDYPFADLLDEANKKVCEEALNRVNNSLDLSQFDYIIITGGTGAAWLELIKDKFKKLSTITILYGNQNDNLPLFFSNVRGYYLYRFNMLGREIRNAGIVNNQA